MLTLLETREPSSISIERLCQAARVSRATFYRRWRSIDPIITETALMLLDEHRPPGYGEGELRGDLLRSATNIGKLLEDDRVRRLFLYAFLKASQDPDMRSLIHDLEKQRNASLAVLIERAQREGRVRRDVRADLLSYQVFGPIWHRTLLLQLPATEAFVESVVDGFCRSLAPQAD